MQEKKSFTVRQRALEQSILFVSVVKWFLLASVVGLLVGASTTIFLHFLDWGINTAAS